MSLNHETVSSAATLTDSPLYDRICDLVALAYKGAANDEPDIACALADAARWNPAMLQAAIGTAHELTDDYGQDHLDATIANMRRAAQLVRRRVY